MTWRRPWVRCSTWRSAQTRIGVRARLDLQYHFRVREIGESKLAIVAERLGAEMGPEIDQPVLGLAVDLAKPLALHIVDARLHQLERDARAPILMAHGEPFDLGEVAEKAHPQAARRLVADEADEMRG